MKKKGKEEKLSVKCLDYVEIDVDTIMVTVLEKRTVPGFFSDNITEVRNIYIGLVRERAWVDGCGGWVPFGSELSVALWGIAVNKIAQKKLDRYCGI
jgi:hypothetical protein